jgi:hypothetical protein
MRKLTKPELYAVNRRRDNSMYSIKTVLPNSTQSQSRDLACRCFILISSLMAIRIFFN